VTSLALLVGWWRGQSFQSVGSAKREGPVQTPSIAGGSAAAVKRLASVGLESHEPFLLANKSSLHEYSFVQKAGQLGRMASIQAIRNNCRKVRNIEHVTVLWVSSGM
jgi:hypothetical protein